jgi:hypothetical protein
MRLTEAACLREYKVFVRFDSGNEGVVDLENLAQKGGVFAAFKDNKFFRTGEFDPAAGTICWPNGIDIAPEFLYNRLKENQ